MTPAAERVESVQPVYLTPADVAALLKISAKSVYRYAKTDPTFPTLRIGGVVRFPRERLERWLREREQGRGRIHSIEHQKLVLAKSVPA